MKMDRQIKKQLDKIKKSSGVCIFRGQKNKILYIGKAKNLRARVRSYFINNRDNRPLVPKIVDKTKKIETVKTNSEIEAILLEARLIKKNQPPFNLRQKDDKSFIYVFINFSNSAPRVQFIRQKEILEERIKQRKKDKLFGPFISAHEIKKLLNYFRQIIPFRDCGETKFKKYEKLGRGCQWTEIGKCSAPCTSQIDIKEYRKSIAKLSRLLSGKIENVKKDFGREMKISSEKKKFEQAAETRDRIKTLDHIKAVSMIDDHTHLRDSTYEVETTRWRGFMVEAVDVSNISGKYASGAIVAAKFKILNPKFDKNGYRRFKIRTKSGPDDVGMIREVIKRRLNHSEWKFPDLLIIDGGRGQLKAVNDELRIMNYVIPIIAIAKGPTRKGEKLFFSSDFDPKLKSTLLKNKRVIKLMRDEAHRFVISYHKILRIKGIIGK